MKEETSEFGKGLTYCIGLFLAHVERFRDESKTAMSDELWPGMWFNSASDHLYELDISKVTNKKLHKELCAWQQKVLHWGHGFQKPSATKEDVYWSIEKAKEFLRQIDAKMLNVKTIKGSWE